MPLASIHLFSLSDPSDLPSLLKYIDSHKAQPLTLSKPIRWIVKPEHINADVLLSTRWDLLLIIESNPISHDLLTSLLTTSTSDTPSKSSSSSSTRPQPSFKITRHFTLQAGIPTRLLTNYHKTTNPSLLHPSETPKLTGSLSNPLTRSTSQSLALSPSLQSWIGNDSNTLPVPGAVSMLNFLSFKPGRKAEYLKYGKAFAETIGSRRGGNAKLVGNVVGSSSSSSSSTGTGQSGGKKKHEEIQGQWHEFALAHYPSLLHFADMLASEDYQAVNERYRVPSLFDTCILCTSELEVEKILQESGGSGVSAKL